MRHPRSWTGGDSRSRGGEVRSGEEGDVAEWDKRWRVSWSRQSVCLDLCQANSTERARRGESGQVLRKRRRSDNDDGPTHLRSGWWCSQATVYDSARHSRAVAGTALACDCVSLSRTPSKLRGRHSVPSVSGTIVGRVRPSACSAGAERSSESVRKPSHASEGPREKA